MKISVTDKKDSGIMSQFALAIGTTLRGRFVYIPENKGAGYLTGFSWGSDLRMMIRNYYLNEDVLIERINENTEGQQHIIFLLSGIFPSLMQAGKSLGREQPNILICRAAVSSVINMPSDTFLGSITIRASRQYLHQLFGHINHPVVASVLQARDNFVLETGLSSTIINIADYLLRESVPESIENHFYKLKCEELLCYIFALLIQREATPLSKMHLDDVKAIYAIKLRLQSHRDEAPDIAALAKEAGMSAPKMRKLFRQMFGKGVFEYYQSARMQEAARLLKNDRLTVSEVGYQLGFSNLSHFTRVFEQYIGMKPKKYSST